MTSNPPRIVVAIAFDSPLLAQEALLASLRLQDEGLLDLHDAVFISRPGRAPAQVTETTDPTPVAAAVPASLVGAIVGTLLGGPIGFLIGGVLGGSTGAVAAKIYDSGISDQLVAQLRHSTAPGQSVLALLVDHVVMSAVLQELHRFSGAQLVYAELPPAQIAAMRQALA